MPKTSDGIRYQRLPSGRYRAQPTNPATGRRESITAPDLATLCERVRQVLRVRADLRAGVVSPTDAMRRAMPAEMSTLAAAWDRYAPTVTDVSRGPADAARRYRLERLASLKLHELTAARLTEWEAELLREYAPATVIEAYWWLHSCVTHAKKARLLAELPWGDWRPKTKKGDLGETRGAVATVQGLAAVLSAARDETAERAYRGGTDGSLFWRVLVFFLTGLRQGELAGLSWRDVSIDAPPYVMRVQRQAVRAWNRRGADAGQKEPSRRPKAKRVRAQVMHDEVVVALRRQREALQKLGHYREDGPVFPGRNGQWRTSGVVVKPEDMREIARRAGRPDWKQWVTHSTRHSFASMEAIASGGDLESTRQRTGHASVRQLENYMHRAGVGLPSSPVALPGVSQPEPLTREWALVPPGESVDRCEPAYGVDMAAPLVDLSLATVDRERMVEREKTAKRKRETAMSLGELADDWRRQGSRGDRPPEVTRRARAAYVKAYNRARGRGDAAEKCQEHGRRAKAAFLASWARELKRSG